MPRENGHPVNAAAGAINETIVFTESSAFANDDD
jgi:hypothetical protein